jgi:hypothetical protein
MCRPMKRLVSLTLRRYSVGRGERGGAQMERGRRVDGPGGGTRGGALHVESS